MKTKEYNKSSKSYWSRRVQDNPENPMSHRYLASLHGESQETLKEQKHLHIALSINPDDFAARNDLALSLFRQGNLKHA